MNIKNGRLLASTFLDQRFKSLKFVNDGRNSRGNINTVKSYVAQLGINFEPLDYEEPHPKRVCMENESDFDLFDEIPSLKKTKSPISINHEVNLYTEFECEYDRNTSPLLYFLVNGNLKKLVCHYCYLSVIRSSV